MGMKPCLDCRTLSANSRCEECTRLRERARDRTKRQRRPYTKAERNRRAKVVAAWREQNGDWCPGWQRPPHASGDLTADHVHPVAAGGAEEGLLSVLCRSCNGRKEASTGTE